jgi:hypothetical protein
MRKHLTVLILIFILAFAIRSFGLNTAIYDDEQDPLVGIYSHDDFGLNPTVNHAPLMSWAFQILANISQEIWFFRLFTIVLGITTLFLTYLLGKNMYNKQVGLIAVSLMSVSFYHILASNQFNDEVYLLFFYCIFIYLYFNYKNNLINNIKLGFVFGLAMLSKESAVLLILIISFYELILLNQNNQINFKKVLNLIKTRFIILIIGILIFLIVPLLAFISDSKLLNTIASRSMGNLAINFSFLGISMFLFWATPFLIGLFIISSLKYDKKNNIFLSWFVVIFVFYIFFVGEGDYSRYFMNLIVPIILISANFLSKIKFKNYYLIYGSLIFGLSYWMFDLLNKGSFEYVPRLMSIYISKIKNMDLNFLFSYTSSSGPLFYISFISIFVAFIFSGILILLYIASKNKQIKIAILISFIAVSFAFNLLLVNEYLFAANHPDIDDAILKTVEYYRSNDVIKPIYANNNALLFYFDTNYLAELNTLNTTYYYTGIYGEGIYKIGLVKTGTIFLLDHTPIPRNSELWNWANSCDLIKEITSKERTIVYVFECRYSIDKTTKLLYSSDI